MVRPGLWRRDFSAPLQSLQGELNRLIEGYWNPLVSTATGEAVAEGGGGWVPPVDLRETSGELVLVVDLPGVDPTSIDLSLAGNLLTLRGEKTSDELVGSTDRIRERSEGAFHREVTLTGEVDFDRVQAESKNGVLTVRMPRAVAAQPRSIEVRSI